MPNSIIPRTGNLNAVLSSSVKLPLVSLPNLQEHVSHKRSTCHPKFTVTDIHVAPGPSSLFRASQGPRKKISTWNIPTRTPRSPSSYQPTSTCLGTHLPTSRYLPPEYLPYSSILILVDTCRFSEIQFFLTAGAGYLSRPSSKPPLA